uniref:Uncharacterized protein n=1 Tax=Solemoviridae sp. TaxID=2715208 RepID=A0A6M3YQB6_9VIRU|nr:MAG: hypothetical protein 1 [Solemoviridae sp.]
MSHSYRKLRSICDSNSCYTMLEFDWSVAGLVLGTSLTTATTLAFLLWVIRAWCRRCERRAYEEAQEALLCMPESMRLGSDLVTDPPSRYEWLIGVYSVNTRTNNKVFLASGVILNGFFITCHHAIAEENHDNLYVRTHDNQFHKAPLWSEVEADIVAANAAPGYKSAKVRPLGSPTHAKVLSAKASQNSSFGVLKHERDMCGGRLSYTGSTVAGFSGSPYTNGQQVLGVHLGGGSQGNYGVSASLIYAATTKLRKPESSELMALTRALRTAKRSDVFLDVGQDDVRVDVNGRFFYLSVEEFDRITEEEEFLDHFLEEPLDEEGPRRYRKNWKERQRYSEEPDYEPEGTHEDEGEAPFLGQTPPPVSDTGALSVVTDTLHTLTSTMESMRISMEAAIAGLQAQQELLQRAFMSTQSDVERQLQQCNSQMQTNLNMFEQRLTMLTTSHREGPSSQEIPTSTSISVPSSEPLTPRVAQASEPSRPMQPLVMHWDGMESDLQKYIEWRSSRDLSSPDFVIWREEFLTSLGLTTEQKKALISRFKNLKEHSRAKRNRKPLQLTTSSSS